MWICTLWDSIVTIGREAQTPFTVLLARTALEGMVTSRSMAHFEKEDGLGLNLWDYLGEHIKQIWLDGTLNVMVVSVLILNREKITDQLENWIKRTVNMWNFRKKTFQKNVSSRIAGRLHSKAAAKMASCPLASSRTQYSVRHTRCTCNCLFCPCDGRWLSSNWTTHPNSRAGKV